MKECKNCQHGRWALVVPVTFPAEGPCVSCRFTDYGDEERPSNWEPQSMTNGDRFRAKSDEKLASFIATYSCPPAAERANCGGDCPKCWLDWLKQPAKDGEGDV